MTPEIVITAIAAGIIAGSLSTFGILVWLLRRGASEAQGCQDIECEAMRSGAWRLPTDATHDDARLGDVGAGFEGWS